MQITILGQFSGIRSIEWNPLSKETRVADSHSSTIMICIICQFSLRLRNPRAIPSHTTSRPLLCLGILSPPSIPPSEASPSLTHIRAMSNSQGQLSPNGPYAPKIPHFLYLQEKADFIGVYVGSIFYGTRGSPPTCLSVLTLFGLLQGWSSCCPSNVWPHFLIPSIVEGSRSSGGSYPSLWPCSRLRP